MSYTHAMSRGIGLGDDGELGCLNKANNSPQVMAIDNMVDNLGKNWNPTGFFRPTDIQTLLDSFAAEAEEAGKALASAPNSTSDAESVKREAFNDMLRRYRDRSQAYVKAVAEARAAGASVVNAPALKSWVIASMRSISDAYVTATVLACRQTWIERWLDRAYRAMVKIGELAFRMIGVVVKVGESVIDAVDTAGDIAAFAIKYAPYAAAGLGAYLLYHFVKKRA